MGASFASNRSPLGVAGIVFIAVVLFAAGCSRQSSHESTNQDGSPAFETEYDSITKGAGADQPVSDTSRFFDGSRSVKINYRGDETCPGSTGCGEERGSSRLMYTYASPGFSDGYEGYLGGAYFLPRAFQSQPSIQKGYIELFRWDNAGQYGSSADKGGIAVSASTHEGQLFRAETVDAVEGDSDWHAIGPKFKIPFGRWADIYVHQRLQGASLPTAINEVFVNGKLVVTATGTQNSQGRGFDRLVWGLPQMDSVQVGDPINFWFDRAYASNESAPPPSPDPNVLVIVTDDQRWGQTTSTSLMPNLRKWFKEGEPAGTPGGPGTTLGGQEITNTYAATPECCPSRASILTGLYAHNHGIRQQDISDAASQAALVPLPNLILPHYLKQRNYQTGILGKFLNGWSINQDPPAFDKFSIFGDPNGPDYCPFWTRDTGGTVSQHGAGTLSGTPSSGDAYCNSDADSNSYSTTYFGNKAKEFIEQADSNDPRPWFLYLAPYGPHPLPIPEAKYNGALPGGMTPEQTGAYHEADVTDKPQYVQDKNCCIHNQNNPAGAPDEATRDKYRADQLRALRSVDDVIGQVFTTLRTSGEENNTLAIFVSDNGYIWGEHWLEGKLTPYTYSMRVPMYVRWPGRVAANTAEPRLASTVDIAPTVLDALEPALAPSTPMDGRSLLDTSWTRPYVLSEYQRDPDINAAANLPSWAMVRGTNWQYTRTETSTPGNYFKEYYTDLPNMLTNIYGGDGVPGSGDPPPKETELDNAINCHGTTPPTTCP